jgi:hypothetical protein
VHQAGFLIIKIRILVNKVYIHAVLDGRRELSGLLERIMLR